MDTDKNNADAPAQAAPETPPTEPSKRPAIRTFHSDIAESVRDNNTSLTSIALAQQQKNEKLGFVAEEKPAWWSVWSVGSIALGIGGILIVVGALVLVMHTASTLPFGPGEAPPATLVPAEAHQTIDASRMTRTDLFAAIETFITSNYLSPVAIEALHIQEEVVVPAADEETEPTTYTAPITLERFFERIGARAPGRLVRALEPTMTFGRAGDMPFLLVSATSYEAAFAGMLEWEPLMHDDLFFVAHTPTPPEAPMLPLPEPTTGATSTDAAASDAQTATTSPSTNETPLPPAEPIIVPPPTWKDIVVQNKDVRALVAHDGTELLLYTFPSPTRLLITQSREALVLIVTALNAPVFGG